MDRHTLPEVVEFDHRHTVKVINDGPTTRIIATPNPKWQTKYKRLHDLPFVGMPCDGDRFCFWFVKDSDNWSEAVERGEFYWNEFVRFARGPQKRRAEDAQNLLRWALEEMPRAGGHYEAGIFRRRMIEAVVAHLRVGVEP